MLSNETNRVHLVIGKSLSGSAHEAYLKRLEAMFSTPFDDILETIKNRRGSHKTDGGYYVSDAIRYFDRLLEDEDKDTWVELDGTCNTEWYKAIEQFRW